MYLILISEELNLNNWSLFSYSGAEDRTFQGNWVNIIAADALAPCVTRSAADMVLIMKAKPIPKHFHSLCHLSVEKW